MTNLPPFTNEVHDWVYALQDQINSKEFEKRFDSFLQNHFLENTSGKNPTVKDMADALGIRIEVANILLRFWSLIPDSELTTSIPKDKLQ